MAIFIGAALQYLEVMNGCTSITSYSETIFREAGSTLSPALSTVIMGVIFLMGSYISATFVDKAGRKVLMIVSAMGCGTSLSIVSGYSYMRHLGFDVSAYGWIPLCCLSLFMLLASVGVISLHMVISSEILSQKIRGPVLSFFIIENWMISFLAVKVRPQAFWMKERFEHSSFQYFPISLEYLGMHGCMLTFALTCFGGALFVLLVLPETKGKSIETIVQGLAGR
jgi:facilitated trehalose transporter